MSLRHRRISFKWSFKPPRSTTGHMAGYKHWLYTETAFTSTEHRRRLPTQYWDYCTCVGLKIHTTSHGIENRFWLFEDLLLHKCTKITWSNKHQWGGSVLIWLYLYSLTFNQEEKSLSNSDSDNCKAYCRFQRSSSYIIILPDAHGDESEGSRAGVMTVFSLHIRPCSLRKVCICWKHVRNKQQSWFSWAILPLARSEEGKMLYFQKATHLGNYILSNSNIIHWFSEFGKMLAPIPISPPGELAPSPFFWPVDDWSPLTMWTVRHCVINYP